MVQSFMRAIEIIYIYVYIVSIQITVEFLEAIEGTQKEVKDETVQQFRPNMRRSNSFRYSSIGSLYFKQINLISVSHVLFTNSCL